MDEWKLGDGNLFGDDQDEGFSIGNKDKNKEGDSVGGLYNKNKDNDKIENDNFEPKKRIKRTFDNRSKLNNSGNAKKIFYILLGIVALISAYYLFHVLFSRNNLNIKIFDLKEKIYKSKVLPENNLVITGYLVNKNKFPIGYAKLTCRLYSPKNIILVKKHIYAGNFISIKKLKNMSNVAINLKLHNKSGNNMSNVEILPNHPVRIMAVFFNIPSNSKNYSITIKHFYRIKK